MRSEEGHLLHGVAVAVAHKLPRETCTDAGTGAEDVIVIIIVVIVIVVVVFVVVVVPRCCRRGRRHLPPSQLAGSGVVARQYGRRGG